MAYLEELLPEFRKGAKIRIIGSEDNNYYYIKHNVIYNQNGTPIKDFSLSMVMADIWELYQEPIDWGYIVKNKCLCYFWGGLGKIKYLNYLQAKEEHTFRDELGSCWDNCRPVRRDEVTFYESGEDEQK